jgi:hypothetical protein
MCRPDDVILLHFLFTALLQAYFVFTAFMPTKWRLALHAQGLYYSYAKTMTSL